MTHKPVILVGVDGSEASLLALDWATAEARQLGWQLHVVCVFSMPSFTATMIETGYPSLDDNLIQDGAQSVLDDAVARVPGDVVVTSALEVGDPSAVLVELSRDAGLVVLGKHGGGFADRLLGAVSSAVPAHAHCPTVVVPFRDTEPSPHVPVRRIVVGVDGSESAQLALARAIAEAEAWEAELTAVAAVPIAQGSGAMAWLPASIDRDELLADVRAGLDDACGRAQGGSRVEIRRHVLDGSAAALLTEFSTAVDLLVVGTRGRGGFAGLMLGSTSQNVMARSDCPVLVVPARLRDEGEFPTRFPWQR